MNEVTARFAVRSTRQTLLMLFFATFVIQGVRAQNINVEGYITDSETGEPLQYAVIGIPELQIWALSDSTGLYHLVDITPGTYRFIALRRGYYWADQDVRLAQAGQIDVEMQPENESQPIGPGAIVGRVVQQGSNTGIDGVEITVIPTNQTVTTDAQGRFDIRDISAGAIALEMRRIGYQPRTDTLASFPGVTLEVQIAMSEQAIQLDPIEVTARPAFLEAAGFYRRAQSGGGYQFTRADIERRSPVYLSRMLFNVPGIRVGQDRLGNVAITSNRGSGCLMDVWVDGMRMPGFDIDTYPVEWVEAIEVYHGVDIPNEYYSRCGVVLIWTRQRAGTQ